MSASTPALPDDTRRTVFVSYSHWDEECKKLLLPHLQLLAQAGLPTEVWEDRQIDGGATWYREITQAMTRAAVAVCLISPDYLKSDFCVKEEVPFLLKRRTEDGLLFLPILIRPCLWQAFDWLKDIQMLPRDGKTVLVDFKGQEDTVFAQASSLVFSFLGKKPARTVAPARVLPPAPAPAPKWGRATFFL